MHAELRLSLGELRGGVEELRGAVMRALVEKKIEGTVVESWSVCKQSWAPEPGCCVYLYNLATDEALVSLWESLKEALPDLRCCHVKTFTAGFSGCIYDLARPSRCPHMQGQR